MKWILDLPLARPAGLRESVFGAFRDNPFSHDQDGGAMVALRRLWAEQAIMPLVRANKSFIRVVRALATLEPARPRRDLRHFQRMARSPDGRLT